MRYLNFSLFLNWFSRCPSPPHMPALHELILGKLVTIRGNLKNPNIPAKHDLLTLPGFRCFRFNLDHRYPRLLFPVVLNTNTSFE